MRRKAFAITETSITYCLVSTRGYTLSDVYIAIADETLFSSRRLSLVSRLPCTNGKHVAIEHPFFSSFCNHLDQSSISTDIAVVYQKRREANRSTGRRNTFTRLSIDITRGEMPNLKKWIKTTDRRDAQNNTRPGGDDEEEVGGGRDGGGTGRSGDDRPQNVEATRVVYFACGVPKDNIITLLSTVDKDLKVSTYEDDFAKPSVHTHSR